MTKTEPLKLPSTRPIKIVILLLIPVILWIGLNYRQLYAAWLVRSETQRLTELAAQTRGEGQNPAPVQDRFEGGLSDFWDFVLINGGGRASNEMAWHSAAVEFNHSLTLQHTPDPSFKNETPDWHVPAADQYNNVSLIGGRGFQPSPSRDVVLKFTARASEDFYGSAGVIFQPMGTLQKNGEFVKPFDMFGFTVTGEETSVLGRSGPVCYLSINFFPVRAEPLQVDMFSLQAYELRLRWIDPTEWLGTVKVDGATQCQIAMPAFGPVEVHVWSDNTLAQYRPRRWWELAPATDFGYQDGGYKEFHLEMIEIFEDER